MAIEFHVGMGMRVLRSPPSLGVRIAAVVLLPTLLASGFFSLYFLQREITAAETAVLERGRSIAGHLAKTVVFDVFSGNQTQLQRLIDYERRLHDAAGIVILDAHTRPVLTSGIGLSETTHVRAAIEPEWRDAAYYHFFRPILLNEPRDFGEKSPRAAETLGYVSVALRATPVHAARRNAIWVSLGGVGLLLLASGLLAWRLHQALRRPLDAAIATAEALAAGQYDRRIENDANGEMGELADRLNRLAERLQKQAQKEAQRVEETLAELHAQKAAAESAMQTKSRLLAALSHDLRQPLHALNLLITALRDSLRHAPAQTQRLARHLEAAAADLEKKLDALLDLSRLEADTMIVQTECVALRPLFARLEQQFHALAAEKGLRLRIFPSAACVRGDPALIERILTHLLDNALRHTEQGGVLLGVRRSAHERVWLSVYDTGPGIDAAYHDQICKAHFRLAGGEPERLPGLGLTLVRHLCARMESPIRLRSRPGAGSAFAIALPRCAEDARLLLTPESSPPLPTAQRPIFVCLDDDEAILGAITAIAETWGIKLVAASDAKTAIADLEALATRPDGILCDYRLRGGESGIEAIARLRAHFGAAIPAALITGDTRPESLHAIAQAGLPILHKPIKPARLRALFHRLLTLAQPKPAIAAADATPVNSGR